MLHIGRDKYSTSNFTVIVVINVNTSNEIPGLVCEGEISALKFCDNGPLQRRVILVYSLEKNLY